MSNPNRSVAPACRDRFHNLCHRADCACGCHRSVEDPSSAAESDFAAAARAAAEQISAASPTPEQQAVTERESKVLSAIRNLAEKQSELDSAHDDPNVNDVFRFAQARRQAEAEANAEIGRLIAAYQAVMP